MKSGMHPEAREELLAAIDYYNDAEPGLGMAFYTEIESAIELIEGYPDLWTEIGAASGVALSVVFPMPFCTLGKRAVFSFTQSCTLNVNRAMGVID